MTERPTPKKANVRQFSEARPWNHLHQPRASMKEPRAALRLKEAEELGNCEKPKVKPEKFTRLKETLDSSSCFTTLESEYSGRRGMSSLKCHSTEAAFQLCFWRPLPVNGGCLNHRVLLIDDQQTCWCALSSCGGAPPWSLSTFFCLAGMRANPGLMAAVLAVMSLLSFSLVSLLCLWCKRKSSKSIDQSEVPPRPAWLLLLAIKPTFHTLSV